MMYRNSLGKSVPDIDAEPGSFFYEGGQVIKLQGKVEIKVEPLKGETEAQAREAAELTSAPLKIYFFA